MRTAAERTGADEGAPRAAVQPVRTRRRDPGHLGVIGLAVVFALFLGLPVVALFVRAVLGGRLVETLGQPVIIDALVLSLVTTAISLVLTVILGTPLAYLLARRRFRGASLVETIVDLPIVLPPSVAGLALLLLFGRRGFVGSTLSGLGIDLAFTIWAEMLAQIFVSAPFYIRSARSGFAAVERDLEDAARVDGATETGVLRHITLPLASAALGAGLVMTWARSLGEFGATILFAGNIEGQTQTLPLVVYSQFQESLDASVAAAAVLVLVAFGLLVAVRVGGIRLRTGVGTES